MDDDGFTTVRRTGRGRPARSDNKSGKTKPIAQIAYTTRATTGAARNGSTTEEKLDKVLAILETRRRQLEDKACGKGKEKCFMESWAGRHTVSVEPPGNQSD